MFDQLFKRASTRARYVTAPFAEERARYLDYCELRGDSRSLQLRKAHDLLWITLNSHSELQVTSDQIRALVVNGQHDGDNGGSNLNVLSTRKRLLGHACAWLGYLGYLYEPSVPIPFGSRLLEYREWAKQQRGLTDSSIYFFRCSSGVFFVAITLFTPGHYGGGVEVEPGGIDSTSREIRVKYLVWLEGPDGTKRRVCFCRLINFRLIVGGAGGVVVSAAFRR